ncbi:5'-deoxyadenosine deaminase [Streptomyces alboniger]
MTDTSRPSRPVILGQNQYGKAENRVVKITRDGYPPRLGPTAAPKVLGRAGEIGSLEPGKLADLVLWKLDTLAHASIADPVTALVFGAAAPVTASFVNGRQIVEDNRLLTADEDEIARSTREEAQRLARIAAQS